MFTFVDDTSRMTGGALIAEDAGLLYVRGLLHLRAGEFTAAIETLIAALNLQPDHSDARRNLIRALLAAGSREAALHHADIALATEPASPELLFARGTALNGLNRSEEAWLCLSNAVALDPLRAGAWLNLGNACLDLDDMQAAEDGYRIAIGLDPDLAEAHASLGHLLSINGALPEAIKACEAAIRLRPTFVQAHWNLATAALLSGDLMRGFREYEWRKRHDRFRRDFVNLPGPVWTGADPTGRTILVHSEQGFGDTIQFARYLPAIAARGGDTVLACDARLVPLFAAMPGVRAVVRAQELPSYDAWIDQMSLPLVFGTTLATIPGCSGYLRADPFRVCAWDHLLPHGRRVGLSWRGNPLHTNDRRRSLPSSALQPILQVPGIVAVSLQPDHALPQVLDLTARLIDFAATAALISSLDLVITVDTAVAHLAGALGVPTWIMLPHAPDWRWLMQRDDSPWYRSVRLFRQTMPGDWDAVIARVAAALAQWRDGKRTECGAEQNGMYGMAELPPIATCDPVGR